MLVRHKVVQTGVDRQGQPKGYILSTAVHQSTGEQITQYHGLKASWVRRKLGGNRVVLVLQKKNRRGSDGRITMPAGTVMMQTREDLGRALRITLHQDTLTGFSRQSTVTMRSDGRSENYGIYRDPTGRLQEERTRWDAKGGWKQLATIYDGQQVHVAESSNKQQYRERTLAPQQTDRLFRRLTQGFDSPRQVLQRYRDHSWTWREQLPSKGNLGTVSARGRDGYLGRIKHGFVSPLGTRFGEVEQHHGAMKPPQRGEKPVKRRTYLPQGPNTQLSEQPLASDMSVVTLADRLRLKKATQLVNQAHPSGARFKAKIDAQAGNTNAYADPYDQLFQAHVSPEISRFSLPGLVGVLGHERKHDTEAQWARHEARLGPWFRANRMAGVGSLLEATVATLQEANLRRFEERRADRASGKTLARVRKMTGDPAMTPREMLDKARPPKGTPTFWTPTSHYDNPGQRRHTVWKAYGQEFRRSQSAQAQP